MMQRLRDQTSSPDAITARAAELLSAVQPLDAKRVSAWARPAAAIDSSRGRPALRRAAQLRTAVIAALSFASLAAAAATAQHAGWIRLFGPAPVGDVVSQSAERAAPRTIAPVAAAAPVVDPVAPTEPAPASSEATNDIAPARRAAPERSTRDQGGSASGESVLMVQAVRALRRDGDPARAEALAEEALRRYPKGTQVEEAMALSMEAASAAGDQASARRAAARYLDRYPRGRFADRARRLVAGSKDGD
jgi:hypothetical protein